MSLEIIIIIIINEYIKEALSNTVAERKILDAEATKVPSPRTGGHGVGTASRAPPSALN